MKKDNAASAKIIFAKKVLSSKKIKDEVLVAFGLIVVTLLVLLGYLFPGVSSLFETRHALPIIVGIILVFVITGFIIIVQIVEPLIKISREAAQIAQGDFSREIALAREDELGHLCSALNNMSRKIRDNFQELQRLSQSAESLNLEINRRIAMLSGLVEISNKIAQNSSLEDTIQISLEKCFALDEMTMAGVVLKDWKTNEFKVKGFYGPQAEALNSRGLAGQVVQLGRGFLGKAILRQKPVVVDQKNPADVDAQEFNLVYGVKNVTVVPVSSKGSAYGLFFLGNNKDGFVFHETNQELYVLVSKNIAIAVLNDLLKRRIEKLELVDGLTGLFNNVHARNKLTEEIKLAVNFQRPCSFVLLKLLRYEELYTAFGHIEAEHALLKVATVLKTSVTEKDTVARFADHEFVLILPGNSKKESIEVAAKITTKIEQLFAHETDLTRRVGCAAAVVENPIDGVTAEELILKSGIILADAIEQGTRVGSQA